MQFWANAIRPYGKCVFEFQNRHHRAQGAGTRTEMRAPQGVVFCIFAWLAKLRGARLRKMLKKPEVAGLELQWVARWQAPIYKKNGGLTAPIKGIIR